MSKFIFQIVIIFIVGTIGGIFADQILWPYFIERPLFLEYRLNQSPVYVNETKEIYIQENTALELAMEKIDKTILAIKTTKKNGKILEGSGIIVTSDGLAVTLAEIVPEGAEYAFYIKEGTNGSFKKTQGKIIKRDLENNLAEIKLEAENLNNPGYADLGKLKLGRRIFVLGAEFDILPILFVNQGIVSEISQGLIETNIFETKKFLGSPLFDIEGGLIGLNTLDSEEDSQNRIITIPVSKIQTFLAF